MAETKEKEKGVAPKGFGGLMSEAMGAYEIKPGHVLSSKEYKDHVVIVTHGGAKVSFAPGDKVKPLSKVDLDGVPPPKPGK